MRSPEEIVDAYRANRGQSGDRNAQVEMIRIAVRETRDEACKSECRNCFNEESVDFFVEGNYWRHLHTDGSWTLCNAGEIRDHFEKKEKP